MNKNIVISIIFFSALGIIVAVFSHSYFSEKEENCKVHCEKIGLNYKYTKPKIATGPFTHNEEDFCLCTDKLQ